MAHSRTGARSGLDFDERAETFFDWIRSHRKLIAAVVILVVAAGAGTWLYLRSREVRMENASRSLAEAQQAVAAGNLALAQSDLERLVMRYRGTPAADQATLFLATLNYDKGEHQKGIARLQGLIQTADEALVPSVENLLGAGYEQMEKFAEAATHYRRAAEAARFEIQRDSYLANAARAYARAGNEAEAKQIWSDLASRPSSAVAAEAQVRLGELNAQAARRS